MSRLSGALLVVWGVAMAGINWSEYLILHQAIQFDIKLP
jgi:hypothetical protein